ncbi:hypothetical protein LguiA_026120 [Lonicera macranthoides]
MAEETKGKTAAEGFIPMAAENKYASLNHEASTSSKQTNSPPAVQMFLKQISDLTEIPLSVLLKRVCNDGVLDLSNTNIKSLPSTISNLVELRELLLRDCKLLMELPPEIGALSNLKVLDLEGTKLICLPKEIEGLVQLECLKVSLSKRAEYYIKRKGIKAIIPRQTLSKFFKLRELSINVDPDCGWWDAEVEVIIEELPELRNIKILRLYLPTVELLQKFLQLPMNLYKNLSNFKLIVGRHEERIISCLSHDLQDKFEELEKCLKYVNGEGSVEGIGTALEHASALLLDRHWTIEKLSAFKNCKMDKLRFCLLVECSEMNTVFDSADFYQDGNKVNDSKQILVWLQCLSIYYMKSLETIWKGPTDDRCLSSLQCLALHTCPRLKIIFEQGLIHNLVCLKELIVADCPQVESLISVEYGNDFLRSLEKISLLHLPEFSNISGGFRIAPFLQRMIVYNCPKLKSLSPLEISCNLVEEIKGESQWWEALEWKSNQPNNLVNVFVPLGRDGHLMDEIAQASAYTSLNNMVHPDPMGTWDSELDSFEKEVFNQLDASANEFLTLQMYLFGFLLIFPILLSNVSRAVFVTRI